jgi:hypothetical protein
VFSRGGYQWKVCGHKERGNEGEYGGCILYPHMKIEEWNLIKLFQGGRGEEAGNGGVNLRYLVNTYVNITMCSVQLLYANEIFKKLKKKPSKSSGSGLLSYTWGHNVQRH